MLYRQLLKRKILYKIVFSQNKVSGPNQTLWVDTYQIAQVFPGLQDPDYYVSDQKYLSSTNYTSYYHDDDTIETYETYPI